MTGSLGATSATARLVWIVLRGPVLDADARALLAQGVGGVVLFAPNIESVDQLRRLTTEIRACAPTPVRIAIDHEGGHVVRMGAPLTRFPSAMAIGATGSDELAYAVARAAGMELASLGIDVVLAPVLDVCADPRNPSLGARCFGSSPGLVARLGASMVRGYRDVGIAAVAKHFPGHGRTPVDSHVDLPVVSGGLDELRRTDLPPFQAAIEAGVDLVMISHVAYDELTDGEPATLSRAVIEEMLRAELRFGGLVVTDAMVMKALSDRHPIPEAAVRSVLAGADVVMPLGHQEEVLAALTAALASGRLPEARLEEALDRIARLDEALTAQRRIVEGSGTHLALPVADHEALARDVAARSLTLLSGEGSLPIVDSTSVAVIEFASRRPSPVEDRLDGTATLGEVLGRRLPRLREVVVRADADATALQQAALDAAADAELVILATRDAFFWDDERDLIARIADGDRPTFLVALRSPHDAVLLAPMTGAAAAYADVPASLEALADALTGRAGWPGTLPVELPSGVPAA